MCGRHEGWGTPYRKRILRYPLPQLLLTFARCQVPNERGNLITPSYVAITDQGRLVGDDAKSAAALDPRSTVFDIKRLIGRDFADENVQALLPHLPFRVMDQAGRPVVKVGKQVLTPEEISASILSKMKDMAESYVGESIEVTYHPHVRRSTR